MMKATATSSPTAACTTSLAASTRDRRGVTRKVGVTVWWRYSVVIPRMPMHRTSADAVPAAA